LVKIKLKDIKAALTAMSQVGFITEPKIDQTNNYIPYSYHA